jgi:carboxymethylenebutenolidase
MIHLALALSSLVVAQDFAKARLEKSPRHQEWVKIEHGGRTLHAFVVFPEVKDKATAVIVIHENRGLTDWVRLAADEFAEAGFIAVAPDLLSGLGPNGGKTSDFTSSDDASKALYTLKPDQVTADLNAAADYAAKLSACNGKVAAAGFCWGGGQTFRFATNREKLAAALVFYGPAPQDEASLVRIKCPVYGFYGGNDARINAGIPKTTDAMKKEGKTYEPITYEGAGHGFMRSGDDPKGSEADKKARAEAWKRIKDLMAKL